MTTLLAENTPAMVTHFKDELKREELKQRQGEKLKRQILSDLVRSADALAGVILAGWTRVREMLETKGFEAQELAGYCRVLLDGIDGSLTGHERLLALADDSGLTAEAERLRDLEAKLHALRAARPAVSEALAVATRPHRLIDERMLAESKAALDRGEYITLDDDYLRRLRAGEDF